MGSTGAVGPITVVLADDHTVMRRGLRMLLQAESDLEVVAEAGDVVSAFQHVRAHRPDVLVLDLNMPGGSSVEAVVRLRSFASDTAVVVLTMEHDPEYERSAYAAGACAYVLKDAAASGAGARNPQGRPAPFVS